jgi:tetratricopeptide (TPR) repeat protein
MSRIWFLGAICALAITAAFRADAEVNLWISYYHAGESDYDQAVYRDAKATLDAALASTEDPVRKAFTLDALGRAYTATGAYAEAEKALQEALCLKEDSLGKESRPVPETLNNLADLHYIAGDREKAARLYKQSLDIFEADGLNLQVSRALNGLALIHASNGEYAEAQGLLERAIAVHNRANRRYHPYNATANINLAILYLNTDNPDRALPLLDHAEYVQTHNLRDDHPDVILRLEATAEVLAKLGRTAEAREARANAEKMETVWRNANLTPGQ